MRQKFSLKWNASKQPRKQGKIEKVNIKKMKAVIEGIQKTKKDGAKVDIWFYPSVLQIIKLNLDDKKRIKKELKETKEKK